MIHNKLYLISLGYPWPSIALQSTEPIVDIYTINTHLLPITIDYLLPITIVYLLPLITFYLLPLFTF